ncbi:MAG: hypothetical protein CVV58_03115 [Tenericutes bacterium HGW-Tenericutes-3]|nr:MAG: hypothetical protein CVV58_03115 [Tenericutes bacterium HGW-Tenericutes-3]
MTEIMMQAYEVLDEIKKDPVYQSMKAYNQLIIDKYSQEIQLFKEANETYNQVMKDGGKYHPDFKEVVKRFSQAKTDLYQKEEVVKYFELEKIFQDDLNEFLKTLSQSVSKYIKTPNKLGIVTQGGSCHVRE